MFLYISVLKFTFCKRIISFATLFSSPEQEVLKVSFCDHAVSVVRASSVINIYLVHPLEATVLFNLHETLPECLSW